MVSVCDHLVRCSSKLLRHLTVNIDCVFTSLFTFEVEIDWIFVFIVTLQTFHIEKTMLSKKKKDMHLSYRNEPRDIFSLQNEVHVNVRRELAKLKCNNGNVDTESMEQRTQELSDVSIENMTSIDIFNDSRTHFRSHEGQIRDIIYIKKCWKAICCNRHLFKNKVYIK